MRGGKLYITKSEHRIPHDDRPDEYIIGETKNHKERRIPIGKNLQKVFFRIRQVHSEYGIETEFIIANDEGRITAPEVSNAMYRRGREAGVRACSIHAIRRTVSSILNTQYDRATVAHIMGHTEQVNSLHYDYDTVALNHKQNVMDNLYQAVSETDDYAEAGSNDFSTVQGRLCKITLSIDDYESVGGTAEFEP